MRDGLAHREASANPHRRPAVNFEDESDSAPSPAPWSSLGPWWREAERHRDDPGFFYFDGASYSQGPLTLDPVQDPTVLLEHCLAWSSDHRVRVGVELTPGAAAPARAVTVVTERWLGVPGVWVEDRELHGRSLEAFVPRGVAAEAPEARVFKGHWRRCGTRAEPVRGGASRDPGTDDEEEPLRHYEALEEWVATTAGGLASDGALALLLPPQLLVQLEWGRAPAEELTLRTLWQPAQGVVLGMERHYRAGELEAVVCTTAIESGPD